MAIEYERVNWDTTKFVNPTNMNTMDAGIKAACDGVDQNSTAISEVNSNLTNFVGKGIVNTMDTASYYMTNMTYDATKKRRYTTLELDYDIYAVVADVIDVTKASDDGTIIPFAYNEGRTITYGCYDNHINQAIIRVTVFGHKN